MPGAPKPCESILDAIGGTPVVQLRRAVEGGEPGPGGVFLKLEHLSPNGSLEDRVACSVIEQAEVRGVLRPGGTVVEASFGNAAIALAMVCRLRGYRLLAVLPDHVPLEFRQTLQLYGAQVELTPAEEGIGGAIAAARRRAGEEKDGWYAGQFERAEPVPAHESLARELVKSAQADGGGLDAVTMVIGTGATLAALERVVRPAFPRAQVIGVEPAGSLRPLHRIIGASSGVRLPLLERARVDRFVQVSDAEAWTMAERLGRREGLLVGLSTGANVTAAVSVAAQLGPAARVYTVACDTGERYFSTREWFS